MVDGFRKDDLKGQTQRRILGAEFFVLFTLDLDFRRVNIQNLIDGAKCFETVPCGMNSEGLPVSLQLAGKHLSEPLLCQVGHAYERATEWHKMHPNI